jgi:hypothetical protein
VDGLFEATLKVDTGKAGGRGVVIAEAMGVEGRGDINLSCMEDPPLLRSFNTTCGGDRATTVFEWFPVIGAMQHWVDLSLFDNGFIDQTYLSRPAAIPYPQEQVTWPGLISGLVHYWRVSALTPDGWLISGTGRFVPCSGPALLGVSHSCLDGVTAEAAFHFAPAAPPGVAAWLDLTIFDNGFAAGSFLGFGPLHGQQQNVVVQGVLANVNHWWRVDNLIDGTWTPSETGHFNLAC